MRGDVVIPGAAAGTALVSSEPLSFWGGFDYRTGTIIDQRHPLIRSVRDRPRVGPALYARRSSTTTAVLLEAVRAGTAPAAILTTGVDSFFALAAIVADVLYAKPVPLITLSSEDFHRLQTDDHAIIEASGRLLISRLPQTSP